MAAHGARRLKRMVDNLSVILGVEAICATEGIEHRAPLTTSKPLQTAMKSLREEVPALIEDRIMSPDIERAAALVQSDSLAGAAGVRLQP